jgi:hypothetical protein
VSNDKRWLRRGRAVEIDDPELVIDLRDGVDERLSLHRAERPTEVTRGRLPNRFHILTSFPAYQRVVHHGPIDGRDVQVKLTVAKRVQLHSTGVEFPLTELAGRVSDRDHLRILTDAFGRDQHQLGSRRVHRPNTLAGAKRQWFRRTTNRGRYGFAITDSFLMLLDYQAPERDVRRRNFGVAYKRILMVYAIKVTDPA